MAYTNITDTQQLSNEELSDKVNDFNNRWYKSKRQNIGLNSLYNEAVDETNQHNSSNENWLPYVKAKQGNINETGEFVNAPGDSRLLTRNIWYSKKPLLKAKDSLSNFNENVQNTNVKQEQMSNAIGSYKRGDGNTVKVKSSLDPKDAFSTAIHESAHRLTNWDQTQDFLGGAKFRSDYFLSDSPTGSDPYWDSKNEQYARIHQAREVLDLDPNTVYTEEEISNKIQNFKPISNHQETTLVDNLFNRYSSKDLTNMFNNSFKIGGIIKAEDGARLFDIFETSAQIDVPLPELPSITSRATTNNSNDGLADSNRRYLNTYNNAKRDGLLFEGNEGDRYGMRYLGERPSGFKLEQEDSDYLSGFLNKRPQLKKRLNIADGASTTDMEQALYNASNPFGKNYKDYLRLNKRTDVVSRSGIPAESYSGRVEVGKRIDEAQRALQNTEQHFDQNQIPYSKSKLLFTDYNTLPDSGRNSDGTITVGLSPEEKVKYSRGYLTTTGGTVAHEAGHSSKKFNTNMIETGDVYSDREMKEIFKESPAYGNVYNNLSDQEKSLLKYNWWKFPNKHDREYSEGYSDLIEMKENMRSLGITNTQNSGYTEDHVQDYLDTDIGRRDRFVRLRGGMRGKRLDKIVDALNTFKNGGKL